jgi:hypothetical protein
MSGDATALRIRGALDMLAARPGAARARSCSKIAEEIAHRAAREGKMKLNGSSVTATVGIGRRGDGRFGFEVALAVKLDGDHILWLRPAPRRTCGTRPVMAAPSPSHRPSRS